MGRSMTIIAACVIVLLVVAAVVVWQQTHGSKSRIESALDTMPDDTQIASFTDWRAARDDLGAALSTESSLREKSQFFDAAYTKDYTAVSLLATFDGAMSGAYGWSVLDAEWEMYGQGRRGAVEVLRMPDDFDFGAAGEALTALSYPAPDAQGVRAGGPDLVAMIEPGLTPQLGYLALLPEERLIVTSDSADYTTRTIAIVEGDEGSLYDADPVASMAAALGESPVATVVTVGDRACITSGFARAASSDRQLARQRIDEVGGVNPLTVLALSTDTRGRLSVVMGLESSDAADADVVARQKLARGEAPDQGGTFDERFEVTKAEVADAGIVLELTPATDDAQLLSDLDRGGLLFAAC